MGTRLTFESQSGDTWTFAPDEVTFPITDTPSWPGTARLLIDRMGFADKLVLEALCWEIIHAVAPPLPPEKAI